MTFLSGFIAIVGPPNVGKSTLLNRILGKKITIVSPKPQTTRNRITGIYHEQGCQMVFMDTPGIHRTQTPLHKSMVSSARSALKEVDLLVLMIEMHHPQAPEIPMILSSIRKSKKPSVLVVNKIDKGPKESLLPIIAAYNDTRAFKCVIPISALTGDGVEALLRELKSMLREGPAFFPEDVQTDQSESFLVAEMIREKIFLHTRQELPYSCAVTCRAAGGAARERSGIDFCKDPRGIGIAEGDPHRPGRENDQEDRTGSQRGAGGFFREPCFR